MMRRGNLTSIRTTMLGTVWGHVLLQYALRDLFCVGEAELCCCLRKSQMAAWNYRRVVERGRVR